MFDKIRKFITAKPEVTKFTCTCCGKVHHNWPAIGYNSPDHYTDLDEDERKQIADLTTDFCTINHPDRTDYFIRCVLFQDVIDFNEQLDYGLWVSLSQKNFEHYRATFDGHNDVKGYFGWICNNLAGYEETTSIPAEVFINNNGKRPEVVPHHDFDHPFVKDYYNGITLEEAHRRIDLAMQNPD